MAGGMGRPGANIGAGLPQAGGQPAQAPQQMPAMPMNNMPAISPMQQYMQSLGINRMGFNPQAYANPGYAAPRAPQVFQPQLRPNVTQSSAPAAAPQKSEMDKMREEIDALRAMQDNQNRYQGNSN